MLDIGTYLSYVALEAIERIEVYINSRRLALAQIVSIKSPDIAITGNFYDSTWRSVCPLKADGTVLESDPGYNYAALLWDNGPDIVSGIVPPGGYTHYANYIANCSGIYHGEEQAMFYGSDVGGKRGRTGWGMKDGKLAFIAFPDGKDGRTPEATRDYVESLGWSDFIMGDGGNKVNYYNKKDQVMLEGNDPSHNLILVYFKHDDEVKGLDDITQRFITKSDCYKSGRTITPKGVMVHSPGVGGLSASALATSWDKPNVDAATHAVIDDKETIQMLPWDRRAWHAGSPRNGGVSANNSHISFEMCEPEDCKLLPIEWKALSRGGASNTVWAVTRLQKELAAWGYDPKGVDGSFGPGCEKALKAFQADHGLTADGSCGPATREALAVRDGSFLKYDPVSNQRYFDAVWGRAVALCAYLCTEYGLDPLKDIVCHSEGYTMDIASNHADVMHWFPEHGKSMNDFRKAVSDKMNGASTTPVVDSTPDAWAIDAVNWATTNGIMAGDDNGDLKLHSNVTRQELVVMLYRMYDLITRK